MRCNMKKFKYLLLCLMILASIGMPVTGCSCSNPAEDAADTIEGMASQEEKAQALEVLKLIGGRADKIREKYFDF